MSRYVGRKNEVLEGNESDFNISDEGILYRKRRLCIPNEEELKEQIMKEAHETPYSVHPRATKDVPGHETKLLVAEDEE